MFPGNYVVTPSPNHLRWNIRIGQCLCDVNLLNTLPCDAVAHSGQARIPAFKAFEQVRQIAISRQERSGAGQFTHFTL